MSQASPLPALADADARAVAARAVARKYSARRLVVFVREDENDPFHPALGFDSLPFDGELHRILESTARDGRCADPAQALLALKVGPSSAAVFIEPESYDFSLTAEDARVFHVLAVLFCCELKNDKGSSTANRQVRDVLESITDAFYLLDNDWRVIYANGQAFNLLQRDPATLIGRNLWVEFPAAVGTSFHANYRRAMEERVTVEFEEYYPEPLDSWYEVKVYPSADGLSVYFRDIGERRRLEERVREVSTPILDIGDRVLLVPLVGLFDKARAALLSDRLLESIRTFRARAAVIDVTGLALIDKAIVERLSVTLKGANLLGCETITVGVSAEVAREFINVSGRVDLLRTCLDLQSGIEVARSLVRGSPIVRQS